MRKLLFVTFSIASLLLACNDSSNPTAPRQALPLEAGQWTGGSGENACMSVAGTECDLFVGCMHGRFPRPSIGGDGSFAVNGTYRSEVGPVTNETGAVARFSGSISGSTMTLRVERTDQSSPPATFTLELTGSSGHCPQLCL